jgi:hypothetical protein
MRAVSRRPLATGRSPWRRTGVVRTRDRAALRVARTIADLAEDDAVAEEHLGRGRAVSLARGRCRSSRGGLRAAPPSSAGLGRSCSPSTAPRPAGFGGGRDLRLRRRDSAAAARPGASRAVARAVAAGQGRQIGDADLGERIVRMALDPGPPLAILRAANVDILTLDDRGYPARRSIAQPPPVLLPARRRPGAVQLRTIAIVGTRRPTEAASRRRVADLGCHQPQRWGRGVGSRGRDRRRGRTPRRPKSGGPRSRSSAPATSGCTRARPSAPRPGHRRDGRDRGLRAVPGRPADPWSFPQRNRPHQWARRRDDRRRGRPAERRPDHGTLALGQGRECYVVPGPMDEPRSAGCLALYREYPGLVRP